MVYTLNDADSRKKIEKYLEDCRNEGNSLRIIDISEPVISYSGDKYTHLTEVGPSEFLRLFANASDVLTNSFHGTVFSIINHKDFLVALHSTRGMRILSLLRKLGLQDRIINDSASYALDGVNYQEVEKKMSVYRSDSEAYLKRILIDNVNA